MANSRKIVYVLGAGASLAAGATVADKGKGKIEIPTQARFWKTFLRLSRDAKKKSKIEKFLFCSFLGYERLPNRSSPEKRRNQLSGVDVEEVFTFLSERSRSPAADEEVRQSARAVWDALVDQIGSVFSRFTPNAETRSTYRIFLKQHFRSKDVVVSFNYDTIFEHSIPKNKHWHYVCVEKSRQKGSIRVLKPHGSVNWENGNELKVSHRPKQCVVVAPTHLKFVDTGNTALSPNGYLDKHPQIGDVWKKMEHEMRAAKALVFIGYSFPPADLYFSSILRSVLSARGTTPSIVIVNPDAIAIRNRLVSRFPIQDSHIKIYFDLNTFLQASRQQIFS